MNRRENKHFCGCNFCIFEDSTLILVSIPTNLTIRMLLIAVKTCLVVPKFMFCRFFAFLAKNVRFSTKTLFHAQQHAKPALK